MELRFNQEELRQIGTMPELERFVGDLGQQVADRANARAAALFKDRGGSGVGSIESKVERDERGVFARIGYPAQYWYMNLHEVGTSRERPRPHLRPALFGVRSATGGKESAIRRIRQDKKAAATTKTNREAAKARTTTKRSKRG